MTGPSLKCEKKSVCSFVTSSAANRPLPLMRKVMGSGFFRMSRNSCHSPSGTMSCKQSLQQCKEQDGAVLSEL